MQWLRHTRHEAPTVADQHAEVRRQAQIKMLAAQADARWAAKPSALDAPDKQQPVQVLQSKDPNAGVSQMNADEENNNAAVHPREEEKGREETAQTEDAPTLKTRKRMRTEPKDSPWKQATKGNPGDEWQPASWSPGPAKRRA
jgi:NADH dehydrogenase [ubiquinone] 1 alpha subcomplex assembly factor 2